MLRGAEVSPAGVYLMDGGSEVCLWVGAHASPSFLRSLFGTERPADGSSPQPSEASDEARRLHALIDSMREGRPHRLPVRVLVQGSSEQPRFFSRLAADGYEQFCLALHGTRVQPKL